MRLLVILTLTISAFAYGWMHQEINLSPNYSSTIKSSAVSTKKSELADDQILSSTQINFFCDRRSDSLELVKFYNATGGQNWIHKWDLNKSLDSWYGIGLNNEGCVKYIDMDGKPNGIKDSLLTNSLTGALISLNLGQLEGLLIPNNKISGSIPELLNLPNLTTLVLEANQFSGEIPGFSNLQNLKQLWLNDNKLTGNIVNFNLPALQELNLSRNLLTGTIPNFDKIPNVYWLFLSDNQLTGNVPDFMKMPNLSILWLYSNQLSGTIPNFNKPFLYGLLLGSNNLTGSIPNFDNLGSLRDLNLSGNKLSGNIPVFNKVPFLKYLLIAENDLEGVLPDHSNTNIHLDLYYLQNNRITFSGMIPNLEKVKTLTNITNKECPTCTYDTLIYAPQQKIYSDTTIIIATNSSYTLDLLIDDTVTTNTYTWHKNGTLYKTIKGSNKLTFAPFTTADAGTYTVKITNPLAPQLTLESWPIRLNAGPSLVCDRRSDSLELVKFYNATGANWWKKWDLSKPINTWFGIRQNSEGCVSGIFLGDTLIENNVSTGNNLKGGIIPLNLPNLLNLNLGSNQISGSIKDIESLPTLKTLNLFGNLFQGNIPDLNLPNLIELTLSKNNFTGSIPNFSKMPQLEYIEIAYTPISGMPPFNLLPELKYIYLHNNAFTGTVPSFDQQTKLEVLQLYENTLMGSIPNFDNNPKLSKLWLQGNNLTGNIPVLTNCPLLSEIRMEHNQLAGSIPDFNRLRLLKLLILHHNGLTGSLPPFNGNPILENIELHNNQLSGVVPIFPALPNLGALTLSDNKFIGPLPILLNFPALREVWLSGNSFTGFVPDFTKSNSLLRYATLGNNKLTFSGIINNKHKDSILIYETNKWGQSTFSYAPQQKIFVDTTIIVNTNSPYTLDLLIDDTVTTSTYAWYKDGTLYKTIKGSNKLPFTPFTNNDIGTYTVKITNPLAPQLKLESWPIRLNSIKCMLKLDNIVGIGGCDAIVLPADDSTGVNVRYYFKRGGNGIFLKPGDLVSVDTILYKFTGDSTCYAETKVDLHIEYTPKINFIRDTTVCGSYILPKIRGTNLSGGQQYSFLSGGQGTPLKDDGTAILTKSSELYAYDANSFNCKDERKFLVTIINENLFKALPDTLSTIITTSKNFDILANDLIPKNNLIVKINEPNFGKIIYSQSSGKGTYTPQSNFIGNEILNYSICYESCPNVCSSSTLFISIVNKPCSDRNSLVLPNVIFPDSPSGDNRYFIVEALIDCPDAFGPKPTKLTVYNRWGDLVYRNDDYKNDWEGTNTQGQPLPTGTYYYLLDLGSVSAPIKGYVVIMR